MMRKTKILLVVLALLLTVTAAIGTASAYFTTHASAAGTTPVIIKPTVTTMTETVDTDDMTKTVSVKNEEGAPCYVRIIAFASTNMTLDYEGEGWSEGEGGYMVYAYPIEEGESTADLVITIGNVPEDAEEGDYFNVIVAYETIYVTYDDNGDPLEPDWSIILQQGETTEGEEELL